MKFFFIVGGCYGQFSLAKNLSAGELLSFTEETVYWVDEVLV